MFFSTFLYFVGREQMKLVLDITFGYVQILTIYSWARQQYW